MPGQLSVPHTYMSGARCPGVEPAQHLFEMVLGVGGQRISSSVNADRCASRNIVIEFDVGRLRQIELHVPVAVRIDGFGQLLAQLDLGEGGAVGRKAAGGKGAGACKNGGNTELD